MSSMNPEVYYESEENYGSYVYVTLEEMVLNFMQNYTGDGTILNKVSRAKVIYNFKQGIKKFTMNALHEVRAIELELGDTLDIILPPDYLNYVRISYVNPDTGELMTLSKNENVPLATAYLQDHEANILFDDEGFVLEGTTYMEELSGRVQERIFTDWCEYPGYYGGHDQTDYKLDPTKNINGTFNIDTRQGKIHFSSDNATRVIMLEYISDGLEYSSESDIKVSKFAEEALYNFVNYEMMKNLFGIPMYEKTAARKSWEASYTNTKISMMDIKISDVMMFLNAKRKWFR